MFVLIQYKCIYAFRHYVQNALPFNVYTTFGNCISSQKLAPLSRSTTETYIIAPLDVEVPHDGHSFSRITWHKVRGSNEYKRTRECFRTPARAVR